MISLKCPSCSAGIRAPDQLAGKRGKCPKCQGDIQVPAAAEKPSTAPTGPKPAPIAAAKTATAPAAKTAPAAAPAVSLREELLSALAGEIPRAPPTLFYRLSALLVAIFMVLLPVLYVGLIVLVGYGAYWHTVNNVGMLQHAPRGKAAILVFMAYGAPAFCGAILVFFMVKPIFAPPGKEGRRRNLTRQSEPLLFAVVERLCALVGSPVPQRIDVDCDLNASAGFRRGAWSMIVGSDLVLTIGIPLVEALTLRQFLGVLAHEFGHFTQGAGMRLTYIVRSINFWFLRVVYQRDAWDEWLVAAASGVDFRIGWLLYLSLLAVWISRCILRLFMMAGMAVSSLMLRHMEFDADRFEAHLAGSETFASTARKLAELQLAQIQARQLALQFLQQGHVPDNMPRLIGHCSHRVPPDMIRKLHTEMGKQKTGIFDTHPCDADRIAAAARENAPGLFHLDRPATVLFQHYNTLSKNVTWDLFCDVLDAPLKPQDMKPIDSLIAPDESAEEEARA